MPLLLLLALSGCSLGSVMSGAGKGYVVSQAQEALKPLISALEGVQYSLNAIRSDITQIRGMIAMEDRKLISLNDKFDGLRNHFIAKVRKIEMKHIRIEAKFKVIVKQVDDLEKQLAHYLLKGARK